MAASQSEMDATDERQLVAALCGGDEAAFVTLIEQYQTSLLRLAMTYVPNQAVAEDVVQETWLGVLQGINQFEGRSSLKTWIFTILTNRAKRRGEREHRTLPFSALHLQHADDTDEPAVAPERFRQPGQQWAGGWITFPHPWDNLPEDGLVSAEIRTAIDAAIATLPPVQRQVIILRDIEGWRADEICNLLCLSETNQRVLLHRARSKVRRAIEQEFAGD
ncbi:MAG TPA: sigma-70 family RNA polymerase sigma factor [Thermomicrobiales bacterium]|jgi:RNA polymerase sigma-70 factor (ECF subfamily)|nr:sigma-70 family RNA polymerase sigma factor [Thermomicrobiales bacterium]